jgi:DNA modification methylase
LLEGKQADLVLVDPQCNIAIAGDCSGREANIATASGELSEDQFIAFLTAFLQRSRENTKDGAILFAFTDWRHLYGLITASREVGLALKNLVVWAKGSAAMGSFYRCGHELVLVLKNGDAPHTNIFELGQHGRYRTNIWEYAAVSSLQAGRTEDLALHPAVKPTALVADAIRDVTRRGAIVLDPFAGDGTTIIAAEKTGRHGRAIERDPRYCDIIIRRWQQYTGKAARLEGSDLTFADVEARRLAGQSASAG